MIIFKPIILAFIHGFLGAVIGWVGCYVTLSWRVKHMLLCFKISNRAVDEMTRGAMENYRKQIEDLQAENERMRDKLLQAEMEKKHSKEA